MEWPRIIYHRTDGKTKAADGYTYNRCESQAEFDGLVNVGWVLTPENLPVKPMTDPVPPIPFPKTTVVNSHVEQEQTPVLDKTDAPTMPTLAPKKSRKPIKKAAKRKAA